MTENKFLIGFREANEPFLDEVEIALDFVSNTSSESLLSFSTLFFLFSCKVTSPNFSTWVEFNLGFKPCLKSKILSDRVEKYCSTGLKIAIQIFNMG